VPVGVADEKKAPVMERLAERFKADFGEVDALDGLRVETGGGWALVRASNTEPALRLVVEAESDEALEALLARFRGLIDEAVGEAG
jgi:phosphomannomutase